MKAVTIYRTMAAALVLCAVVVALFSALKAPPSGGPYLYLAPTTLQDHGIWYVTFSFRNPTRRHYKLDLSSRMNPELTNYPTRPNTEGSMYATGEIKFFCATKTGNLPKKWKPLLGTGPGPATRTKPSWWDDPSDDGATGFRNADSHWDCCCGHWSFSEATP